MSRILTVLILWSFGVAPCVSAETAMNAAVSNVVPDMAAVDAMSGAAFEKLVCNLLTQQGYEVGNMRASSDYGVDMIANKGTERNGLPKMTCPIDREIVVP